MATQRTATTEDSGVTPSRLEPRPRLFTVDEYYKMAEVGILSPDERVELIDGKIVLIPPIGPRHAFNVERLARLLRERLAECSEIRSQNPIRLAAGAEPEPDVAVVRRYPPEDRVYAARHPNPNDVRLVVEAADSTIAYDLGEKAAMYARHGIPELWVVDLLGDQLVIHRDPTQDGYGSVQALARGAVVAPLAFPAVSFTLDEILG